MKHTAKKIFQATLLAITIGEICYGAGSPVLLPNRILGTGAIGGEASGQLNDPTLHIPFSFPCNGANATQQNQDCTFAPMAPQGRLTLSSTDTTPNVDITNVTTLYYLPYSGSLVSVYNTGLGGYEPLSIGNGIAMNTTSNATNFPANSLQDIYVYNSSGTTLNLCAVQWGTSTAGASVRGASATYTSIGGIVVNNGAWKCNTNTSSVTLVSHQATLLGTIAIGPVATKMAFQMNPAAAAGGTANGCWLGVSNIYNLIKATCIDSDSNTTFTSTNTTWENYDLSSNNRVYWVDSLGATPYTALFNDAASISSASFATFSGVAINGTTPSGLINSFVSATLNLRSTAVTAGMAPQSTGGLNYAQAVQGSLVSGKTGTYAPVLNGNQLGGLYLEITY